MRLATAICVAAVCAAFASPTTTAATITVSGYTVTPGFNGTQWNLDNTGVASPFSGSCGSGTSFGFIDASITGHGDAYDYAWQVFVNGTAFTAPGGTADLTGNILTAGPVTISGLSVSMQHYYSPTSSLARIVVSLRNPGAASIAATVQVPVNLGSDSGSIIRATSSGDTTVTTADRWIVSSDNSLSDPVNTTVFYGPGTPPVTPTAYTQTVFNCAATNGLGATFNVNVPAGTTRSLMFFAGLGGVTVADNTLASAQSAAAMFNSNTSLASDWLSGLSSVQQSQIVNWDFFTTCAAEGFIGAKLTLCRQICEIQHPPATLAGLIKLYMAIYRTPPPCAN